MLSNKIQEAFNQFDTRDPKSADRRALSTLFIEIALSLTRMREKKGLSKRELARRVNTGHSVIVGWETPGYTGYSLSKLAEVANVLGYDISLQFISKESRQPEVFNKYTKTHWDKGVIMAKQPQVDVITSWKDVEGQQQEVRA